jgi:hypothetical protein
VRNVPQETAGLLVQRNQGKISLLIEKEAEKYYKLSNKFKLNVSLQLKLRSTVFISKFCS